MSQLANKSPPLREATVEQIKAAGVPWDTAKSVHAAMRSGTVRRWMDLRLVSFVGYRRLAVLMAAFSLDEPPVEKSKRVAEVHELANVLAAFSWLWRRQVIRHGSDRHTLLLRMQELHERIGQLLAENRR